MSEVSYPWLNTALFFDLPKNQRDAVKAWLDDHGLKLVSGWMVHDGKLTATVYKVNKDGDRYVVNCQGETRAESPGHHCRDINWTCWHAAQEKVTVPLKSPPPVASVNGEIVSRLP